MGIREESSDISRFVPFHVNVLLRLPLLGGPLKRGRVNFFLAYFLLFYCIFFIVKFFLGVGKTK
jgi:hypothetical protein